VNMTQLDLFDNPQLSRRTDKATSHEAGDATRHKLGLYHERVMTALSYGDMTAREAGRFCHDQFGGDSETYRKRMAEMVREKLIEELPPRECSVTGKNATVYKRKN